MRSPLVDPKPARLSYEKIGSDPESRLTARRLASRQSSLIDGIDLPEQVRVPSNRGAEVGVRAFFPFILQIRAIDALQTHVRHTTSDNIEACGKSNDIVLALLAVSSDDALLGEFLNRCAVLGVRIDVDNIDVVAVEYLVVILLEARALDTEGVRWLFGEEDLIFPGIFDAR